MHVLKCVCLSLNARGVKRDPIRNHHFQRVALRHRKCVLICMNSHVTLSHFRNICQWNVILCITSSEANLSMSKEILTEYRLQCTTTIQFVCVFLNRAGSQKIKSLHQGLGTRMKWNWFQMFRSGICFTLIDARNWNFHFWNSIGCYEHTQIYSV